MPLIRDFAALVSLSVFFLAATHWANILTIIF